MIDFKARKKYQTNDGMDIACVNLVEALNKLPGIKTTESCCGHGENTYNIWFEMDTNDLGAIILSRCMSGRYYCYEKGEQRADPQWRVYLADTEDKPGFLLEGKPMKDGMALKHPPAEKLFINLNEHINENFALAKRLRK